MSPFAPAATLLSLISRMKSVKQIEFAQCWEGVFLFSGQGGRSQGFSPFCILWVFLQLKSFLLGNRNNYSYIFFYLECYYNITHIIRTFSCLSLSSLAKKSLEKNTVSYVFSKWDLCLDWSGQAARFQSMWNIKEWCRIHSRVWWSIGVERWPSTVYVGSI